MQRAVETGGSVEASHHVPNGADKNLKHSKSNDGQLDHNSLTASDYISTPLNKSVDDLTNLHGYVLKSYSNFMNIMFLLFFE
jgi:hypothetical protein